MKTITVFVNGDTAFESNETFSVQISGANGASIGASSTTVTIVNDDPAPPTASVSSTSVTEGNGGTVTATFTVTLSFASAAPVTIAWSTADGTATAASGDYVAASGTVSFAAGQTSKTFTVTVNGDTLYESNETFTGHADRPDPAPRSRPARAPSPS